ncbi:MAG: mycothiol conjugate amidase Mca [Mycobacteriales bacterium]
MAVHAHPDDESSKGAATMAKYLAEGVEVTVVTCTGGERGEVLNPALDRPEVWQNITEIRRAEMDRARGIIGFRQEWLGFIDSGMPAQELPPGSFATAPIEEATEPLVRLVRRLKPDVMLTYDENGGYPHPDHIMCHTVSVAAFEAAGDPTRFPDSGPPWQPMKLYYHMSFTRSRMSTLHKALLSAGLGSPYADWLDRLEPEPDAFDRVTTRVPCGEYFGQRDAALKAHATQVDPDGMWFAVSLAMQRELWPTEDYQLARTLLGSPQPNSAQPEDDLFAGLRESVAA